MYFNPPCLLDFKSPILIVSRATQPLQQLSISLRRYEEALARLEANKAAAAELERIFADVSGIAASPFLQWHTGLIVPIVCIRGCTF